MLDKHCQRSPQTGQPGSNQTSQSIFVSSHFHSKKLPVTLCYGAFWNENAYFVYANSVAGSIRPFVAGFQVTGDSADLPKLYGLTSRQLNLSPSQHTEQLFKQILGGCQTVVEGLGALRNRHSDAHGKGVAVARPAPRHAELAVNLAGTMATFLLQTWEARKNS
jgi:hypothetical protein